MKRMTMKVDFKKKKIIMMK